MAKDNSLRPFLPVIILFVILTGLFLSLWNVFIRWNADPRVMAIGNCLLFGVTFLSFLLSLRGLRSQNPYVVVRSMYGSLAAKLFICIIAAIIYILSFRKNVNKPALFTCMGLYLVYSFLEVSVLTKLSRKRKNA